MSSQITKRCKATTARGTKCRRNAIKGNTKCKQHSIMDQHNIDHEQTDHISSIVHGLPSLAPVCTDMNAYKLPPPTDTQCKYRNKYGEYGCHNKRTKYCNKHWKKICKFRDIFRLLVTKTEQKFTVRPHTLDECMHMLNHLCNFMFTHRKMFIAYSHYCDIDKLTNQIRKKLNQLIKTICDNEIGDSFKRFNKSLPIEQHLNMLKQWKPKIDSLLVDGQIAAAKTSHISNMVKIQKLSEIYIKNGEDKCAVFSKGIDNKILSFIV